MAASGPVGLPVISVLEPEHLVIPYRNRYPDIFKRQKNQIPEAFHREFPGIVQNPVGHGGRFPGSLCRIQGQQVFQKPVHLVFQGTGLVKGCVKKRLNLGRQILNLPGMLVVLVHGDCRLVHHLSQGFPGSFILLGGCQVIQHKDIDPCHQRKPVIPVQMILVQTDIASVPDRCMKPVKVRPVPGNVASLWRLCFRQLIKAVVILPEHTDIQVIVPGNETAVADRPQQGAPVRKPADLMLLAEISHAGQDLQVGCPGPFHQGRHVEAVPDLIFKKGIRKLHGFLLAMSFTGMGTPGSFLPTPVLCSPRQTGSGSQCNCGASAPTVPEPGLHGPLPVH